MTFWSPWLDTHNPTPYSQDAHHHLPALPVLSQKAQPLARTSVGSASTSSLPLAPAWRGTRVGQSGSKPGWLAHSRTEGFHGESGAVQINFSASGLDPQILQLLPLEAQSVLWPSVALMVHPDTPNTACTHTRAHTRAHAHTCARTSCRRTEGL